MANELPNAAALMQDSAFRYWLQAAGVYVARTVFTEADTVTDHAARLRMANATVLNPSVIVNQLVNIVSCDPDVASLGSTVEAVGQTIIIQKVTAIWTPLSKVLYPN